MEAGAQATEWTATMEVSWILSGFFVQEDVVVEMGMGTPYVMRVIYGWNDVEKRYVAFGIGNDGHSSMTHPLWVDDENMVIVQSGNMEGQAHADRSHYALDGDTLTYRSHHIMGTGPAFEGILGTFERVESIAAKPVNASFMSLPAAQELDRFDACVGKWKLSGWMAMPGTGEKMPIGATETMGPILGGHALHSTVDGDPSPVGTWRGQSYICWNRNLGCYDLVMLDNMGEFTHEHGWFVDDDHMVATSARVQYGEPLVSRGVMELENGKPKGYRAHAIAGTGEPMLVFEMSYAPAED
jgi:hypothetical protein